MNKGEEVEVRTRGGASQLRQRGSELWGGVTEETPQKNHTEVKKFLKQRMTDQFLGSITCNI